MDVENTGSTEQVADQSSGTTSAEPVAAKETAQAANTEGGAPAAPESQEDSGQEKSGTEAEGAVPTAFKPREKFTVMDKELDVPPWLLKAIADADTEKQALDLLSKAHGLPIVKEKYEATRTERDAVKNDLHSMRSQVAEARAAYQRGDLELVFEKLSIPPERVLQWAIDKANYSQLPPDQQRVIDERRDAQRKAHMAENQMSDYQAQMFEQARSVKSQLLSAGLARPDVKSFADTFDARAGKPGSFIQEVVSEGELAWAKSNGKEDLTPDQAIERVIKKWGSFVQPSQATAPAGASVAQPGVAPGATATPPSKTAVIPNVAGRSTSPMKGKPRSLEDLKKLSKDLQA